MTPIRLGLLFDYAEERWASMDLVGEMLLRNFERYHAGEIAVRRIQPEFRHRAARLPGLGAKGVARNLDRLTNRMRDYPRYARELGRSGEFDLFHLVDHSYGQVLHALPPGRSVATCHDLDTFRCILEPHLEPRPRWFLAMARRILTGLQKAAAVACDSEMTRDRLLHFNLFPPERLHVVYLAIDEAMQPDPEPEADAQVEKLLGPHRPEMGERLLHVGTNIPRKRIDVLLKTFAGIRRARPSARLIKVGGRWTAEQASLIESLGIGPAIDVLPFFNPSVPRERAALAAVYRRADLVLQTSDAEGFGLPVAEGMACGTPVLASDIPVLREVGGPPTSFAPVGDADAWTDAALALLDERDSQPQAWQSRRDLGLKEAERFRWATHVGQLMGIYRGVLSR